MCIIVNLLIIKIIKESIKYTIIFQYLKYTQENILLFFVSVSLGYATNCSYNIPSGF